MKTRCRNYGPRKRMTAGVAQAPRQDSSRSNHGTATDESEGLSLKEGRVFHETRAQKPAVKFNPHEDHADAIKDSTAEIESDFSAGSVGVSTRSSTRPSKRLKLSSPPVLKSIDQENKDDHNISSSNSGSASALPNGKKRKAKTKRQWESWGTKGKDAFFEALHEYGKDFDKIQSYIAAKHKRRGDQLALIKNKDQVRHFYYRTLNKISKYVPPEKDGDENDPLKKTVSEINSLICYGELRKKMCGLNDKHGKKLSELISRGNTTIRYNGRNFKIKTPACRALKKLYPASSANSEDSEAQPSTAPSKLFVELTPHDNATWCAVQRMAKNPRLRTTVLTNKPLGSILAFLSKKWPVMSGASKKPLKICIAVPEGFYASSNGGRTSPLQTCHHSSGGARCLETSGDATITGKDNDAGAGYEGSGDVSSTVLDADLIKDSAEATSAEGNLNVGAKMVFSGGGDLFASGSVDVCDANAELEKSRPDTHPKQSESNTGMAGSKQVQGCRPVPAYWTADNCGGVTFGSVYNKLGCPSSGKLKLQYKWESEGSSCQQDSSALKKLMDMASVEVSRLKETRKTDIALLKTNSGGGSNTGTYISPRNMRIAPKTTEMLPFILPSVTTRASSSPTTNELPPPLRPVPKLRKQQRKPVPIVQRTLLPRPMAPPGAVAVSFIPQPGQEVGTILASGAPCLSSDTATSVSSLQAGTASPTPVTTSVPSPVPSPSSTLSSPSAAPVSSPQVIDTPDGLSQSSKDPLAVARPPEQSMGSISQSSAISLADVPPSTVMDLGLADTAGLPSGLTVDQLINNTETLPSTDTLDSIIGLALGTALNDKETSVSLSASEDAGNLMVTSQALSSISPSLGAASASVQVEELNSGISGGAPVTLTTSTLNSILDSPPSSLPASVDGLFCNGTLTSAATSSAQHPQEVALSLPVPQVMTSSLLTSPRNCLTDSDPQWLNGEAPDISFGSLLDKYSTSPKKQSKSASLEELAITGDGKSASQLPHLSSHHLLDADTAMHAMMDESSVDFIRKFRDLASKLDGNDPGSLQHAPKPNHGVSGNTETGHGCLETSLDEPLTFRNILSRSNSGQ